MRLCLRAQGLIRAGLWVNCIELVSTFAKGGKISDIIEVIYNLNFKTPYIPTYPTTFEYSAKNRIGGIDVKMPKVTLPDFQIHGFMISILSEAKGQH